jgi:hypothetical protein
MRQQLQPLVMSELRKPELPVDNPVLQVEGCVVRWGTEATVNAGVDA